MIGVESYIKQLFHYMIKKNIELYVVALPPPPPKKLKKENKTKIRLPTAEQLVYVM